MNNTAPESNHVKLNENQHPHTFVSHSPMEGHRYCSFSNYECCDFVTCEEKITQKIILMVNYSVLDGLSCVYFRFKKRQSCNRR